jgi:hypothetical protein
MSSKTEAQDKMFPKQKSPYINLPFIFAYSLLTGLTAVYCFLIWYGAGLWWSFRPAGDSCQLPLMSILCIAPLPLPIWWQMIHWQFFAIFSLLICIRWGIKSARMQKNETAVHALPIIMHTLWIFFAVCCHLLGALIPMIMIGHIIK